MRVYVIFSEGAGQWSEHGVLRRSDRGFILDVDEREGGGTRVLALAGRTAEVYPEGGLNGDPILQTSDGQIVRSEVV